jgi:PAS domain S-box-containing protein
VIIRDVTAQKEAEAKIRESQSQLMLLRAAIEQSSDSVIVTDDQGVCLYANPAFEKITGRSRKEVIGKTPLLLEPGEHHGKDYGRMRETIEGGKRWERNYVLYRQDGNLYEEEAVVFPVFDDSKAISNFVIMEKDVTEKRKLENVAEAANTMENTGFIFAGIRHEIGNPVNSLLTTLTVLERKLEKLPPETVRQFIRGAILETGRVRFLLSALKNFNLFENPKTRNLELNRFVSDFEALIRKDFSDKGVVVETELPAEETWGLLDPRAFHQVLLNLLTNAADALEGREGPRIVMRVGTAGQSVTVQIRDNGCGLSPGLQKQLFTPFFTTKVQGTGLGLVIVKKLLLKMNSQISIESERDVGTTVTLTIPGGRPHE